MLAFGPLAVPFHFARTRAHFKNAMGIAWIPLGFLLGIVVLGVIALVSSVLLDAFAWALGLPDV